MTIRFSFQKQIRLTNRKFLKQFLKSIFHQEGKKLRTLEYIFCDDPYILKINKRFLKHDYFTDIITFDMGALDKTTVSGEIYISADTVASNSLKFKTSFEDELYRVMFHGVLHLCGYKDKSKMDKLVMRKKENYYLGMFHEEHPS